MEIEVKGKKVLVRVDFNVPLNDEGEVTDDTRLKAALPTIQHIIANGGSAILLSHLGRPQKEKKNDKVDRERFTLKQVVDPLSHLLGKSVYFNNQTVGDSVKEQVKNLRPGEVLLLENTRFHKGEKSGDEQFARALACLADIYVNDAFGTAHRDHASTSTVARLFPRHRKCFGLLMEKELREGGKLLNQPPEPFTTIVGGAKVADKIELLEALLERVNHIAIGGGMAYTFIKAKGGQIGDSLLEQEKLAVAKKLFSKAKKAEVEIHLPADSVIAREVKTDSEIEEKPSDEIPNGWKGLDIGSRAVTDFSESILRAKTIFWNGPMGVFEMPSFSKGTEGILRAIAESTKNGAYSLVGGGDSLAALNKFGFTDKVSFASTGGGAMLSLIKGESLPAVEAMHQWYDQQTS